MATSRRNFLRGLGASATALAAAACKPFDNAGAQGAWFRENVLHLGEDINLRVQRFFLQPTSLAREFPETDISPKFKANGSTDPDSPEYRAMVANNFADWKLKVGGLVETPMEFSLADLRALPAREQITRHDCVEGWSCIGKWKGVQLGPILDRVQPKPEAKFVVFRCFDSMEGPSLDGRDSRYYESIDFDDAHHVQTILAYELNDKPLPILNGAPLRCRVERQLGYKQAKYIRAIELVESFAGIRGGKGGYWEDEGYEWYGGI